MNSENREMMDGMGKDQEQASKKSKPKVKKQYRVVMNEKANDALKKALEKVNLPDVGVQLTKSELASFIFERGKMLLTEEDIKELRATHVNEFKFLRACMSNPKPNSALSRSLKKIVRQQWEFAQGLGKEEASSEALQADHLNPNEPSAT